MDDDAQGPAAEPIAAHATPAAAKPGLSVMTPPALATPTERVLGTSPNISKALKSLQSLARSSRNTEIERLCDEALLPLSPRVRASLATPTDLRAAPAPAAPESAPSSGWEAAAAADSSGGDDRGGKSMRPETPVSPLSPPPLLPVSPMQASAAPAAAPGADPPLEQPGLMRRQSMPAGQSGGRRRSSTLANLEPAETRRGRHSIGIADASPTHRHSRTVTLSTMLTTTGVGHDIAVGSAPGGLMAGERTAITDMRILYNNDVAPAGYTKIARTHSGGARADLNAGGGSTFVYLCVKRTARAACDISPQNLGGDGGGAGGAAGMDPPVVALAVVHAQHERVPVGFEVLCNKHGEDRASVCPNGEHAVWLCMKRSFGHRSISDVAVLIPRKAPSEAATPAGYERVHHTPTGREANLRGGDTGTKIFLAFRPQITGLDPVDLESDAGGGPPARVGSGPLFVEPPAAPPLDQPRLSRSFSLDKLDKLDHELARVIDQAQRSPGDDTDDGEGRALSADGTPRGNSTRDRESQDGRPDPAIEAEAARVRREMLEDARDNAHSRTPSSDSGGNSSDFSEDEMRAGAGAGAGAGGGLRPHSTSADSTDLHSGSQVSQTSPSQLEEREARARRDSLREQLSFRLVTANGGVPSAAKRARMLPFLRGCYSSDPNMVCVSIEGLKQLLSEGSFDDDCDAVLAVSETGIAEPRTLLVVAVQSACEALDNCHQVAAKPLLRFIGEVVARSTRGLHPLTLHQMLTTCLAVMPYEPIEAVDTVRCIFRSLVRLVDGVGEASRRVQLVGELSASPDEVSPGRNGTLGQAVGMPVHSQTDTAFARDIVHQMVNIAMTRVDFLSATDAAMAKIKSHANIFSSPSFCYDVYQCSSSIFSVLPDKNVFQLIASLCKAAADPLPVDGAQTSSVLAEAEQNKANVLRLLQELLKASSTADGRFRSSASFGYQIRRWVITAILTNFAWNHVQRVFQLLLAIMTTLWQNFRSHIKIELAIITKNVLIDGILQNQDALPRQKKHVLEELVTWCESPADLVELFTNFDMDRAHGVNWPIFKELCSAMCEIAVEDTGAVEHDEELENRHAHDCRIAALACARKITTALMNASGHMHQVVSGQAADAGRGRSMSVGWDFNASQSPKAAVLSARVGGGPKQGAPRPKPPRRQNSARESIKQQTSDAEHKMNALKLARDRVARDQAGVSKAVAYLIAQGALEERAGPICNFIRMNHSQLDEKDIGDFLGSGDSDLNNSVRHTFVSAMHFGGLSFVAALRQYLTKGGFRLPGEAQKIERLVQVFAECYWQENQESFSCADTAFILAYSTIMLNTELHNPNLKKQKKMKKSEFVGNNRGIDNNRDLPRPFVEAIYDDIAEAEIKMDLGPKKVSDTGRSHKEQYDRRMRNKMAVQKASHETNELTRSFAQQHVHVHYRHAGGDQLKLSPDMIKLLIETTWNVFFDLGAAVTDKFATDLTMVKECLGILQTCVAATLFTNMHEARKKFGHQLNRFVNASIDQEYQEFMADYREFFGTLLDSRKDVNVDELHHSLLHLVIDLGNSLEQQSGKAEMLEIARSISWKANLRTGDRRFLKQGFLTKKKFLLLMNNVKVEDDHSIMTGMGVSSLRGKHWFSVQNTVKELKVYADTKQEKAAVSPDAPASSAPPSKMKAMERFTLALKFSQTLMDGSNNRFRCTDDQKLEFYGLFKQAINGDCKTARPDIGGPQQTVAEAKWEAHLMHAGMSKVEAFRLFVKKMDESFPEWELVARQEQEQQQQRQQEPEQQQ
eukprot:g2035.t1